MTTTTISPSGIATGSWTHRFRRLLVAFAVVVLIVMSFIVGHLTATSRQGPVATPVSAQVQGAGDGDTGHVCQVGHLRGPC
jgi:peptidoglycan/LPS O-acetylase OafA/YrhL